MIYGYARVSTSHQSLDDQKAQLEAKGIAPENIFSEQISGKNAKRPQLQLLLKKLQKGDTLAVTKLDRLSRSAADMDKLVKQLHQEGITLDIGNVGIIKGADADGHGIDPQTALMLHMLAAFAEFERALINDRIKDGLAFARKNGKRIGRPSFRLTDRYKRIYNYSLQHSIKETALTCGTSESTVKRIRRHVRTNFDSTTIYNGFDLND